MPESRLLGVIELRDALKEIDAKVSRKYLAQALREGAKIIQGMCIANAPVRTGLTRSAIKVRASKKRKKGVVTILVTIGKGMFRGQTFYVGFLDRGHKWGPRKANQLSTDQLNALKQGAITVKF